MTPKTFKKYKICIVGPGVVGGATGKVLAKHGHKVSFLGGSQEKRDALKAEGYKTYGRDELMDGNYNFNVSFLVVPTPTLNGRIKLDNIISAATDLGMRLANTKKYHLVVVKSTVPPGTTQKKLIKIIEENSGKKAGVDFGVCMNPEYLREVSAYEDSLNQWLILIGQLDQKSGDMLADVYSKFKCPIERCTLTEAEMQKYVHNLFNAVKITFFNEMRTIGNKAGVDADKLFRLTAKSCEGMWKPQYGIKNLGPYSGACLPKDTQAFLEWANKHGYDAKLLETTIEVNNRLIEENGFKHQPAEIGSTL